MKEETKELITRIYQLRSDLPEYRVGDVDSKDLINAYHNTISLLVEQVKTLEELSSYSEALTLIDNEIKHRSELYV